MLEFLRTNFASDENIDLAGAFARMVIALFFGLAVAWIQDRVKARLGRGSSPALAATLVLLTVLLCLTTIVVGDNVARAFSIVGALSIVRFRTVVEDTRDTAFVIFAVALGLALGAGYIWLPLIALPVGALAAMCFVSSGYRLTLRSGMEFRGWDEAERVLGVHCARWKHTGVSTRRGGVDYERHYDVVTRAEQETRALLQALSQVEGLQAVDLERS